MKDRKSIRAIALALTASAVGMMPAWLVGALAVQIGASLGFTEVGLGLAVSLFMTASVLGSIPSGHWVRRIGWINGMRWLAAAAVVANFAITGVTQLWQLLLVLTVAGLGNSVAQPASNLSIVDSVTSARFGLAFGIKQAGTPGAMVLAGVAVPLIGVTVGWRWAFVGLGAISLVYLLQLRPAAVVGLDEVDRAGSVGRRVRLARNRRLPLLVLGLGGGLSTASATALAAFIVLYATRSGIDLGAAGLLAALASTVNIAVRLVTGYRADKREGGHFRSVALTMLVAAVGYLVLALTPSPWLVVIGALVAFGGWGWNGLFHMATMRGYPDYAAPATGVIVTGMSIGGVVGPILFGLIVQEQSYGAAWSVAAGGALLGSVLVYMAGLMLRPRRLNRL